MLGVKAASLGKMGSHTLDGASHTDVTSMSEAKGDILVYTGSTWDKLAIGTNNKILIADSSTSTGLAWAEDITIGGDLTVSGDTITANVATIQVEDKNMELNKVGSPSDSNADGGGLTIKGTSDKTITFTNATGDFDFSENVDIASGKTFKVAGTTVLSNNTLGSGVTSSSLTELGTITTGVWNGTAIGLAYGGTGLVGATDGKIVVADGSGAPVAVQAMTANDGTFKHEVGGIEADISAIAKGGLVAGSGSGSMAIRTVGSNDHVLTADSSEATGMKWAAAASGAVTALNNATANELVTVGSTTTELDAEANLTFDGSGDLEIGAGSSGDPRITFDINSTDEWTVGVDDSDSDKFKIDTGAAVGGATKFSLDSSGNAVIAGALTLGSTSFANSDGVLQVAGQTNITSLGTLTALTVDDIGLDSKTVTMTGSSGDTATLVVAANGAFSINTNDASASAAHLTVDIDGDITFDAHTGIFKFFDAGSEVFRITESGSGDITMKVETNEKDLIFTDNGDNEGFRILDNAAGVKVAGTIELGHASDTTIARASSGAITVEGTAVLLAGAQTGITTILNTSTKVGRDAHNLIDFTTDDTIALRLNNNDVLSFTESSSDVIIKPLQDSKDIVFQQYDGTEVARVEDNGTFNIVTDKLAINGTAVTSTAAELNILDGVTSTATELNILDGVTASATELNILDDATVTTAELNLLDGGTSVGGSITVGDSDGFIVNDGGTMKTIPASDVKTYAGGSGGAYSLISSTNFGASSTMTHEFQNIFTEENANYRIYLQMGQYNQSGTPFPYLRLYTDTGTTEGSNVRYHGRSVGSGGVSTETNLGTANSIGSSGDEWSMICATDTNAGVIQGDDFPAYHAVIDIFNARHTTGTSQTTNRDRVTSISCHGGYMDMAGYFKQFSFEIHMDEAKELFGFGIHTSRYYPDSDGALGTNLHGSNNPTEGMAGQFDLYKISVT